MTFFKRDLGVFILTELRRAPPGQISERVRQRVVEAKLDEMTVLELYNLLDSISQEPPSEISSFVQTLCDVKQFYHVTN